MSMHAALLEVGWECAAIFGRGDDVGRSGEGVEVCIIATPDTSIAAVAASIEPSSAVVMHLSGATPLAALAPHSLVAALHPLQSLPNPELGALALRDCYFAVAGDSRAEEIAAALSGRYFPIADSDRAMYHCAAAIASNHTVALLGQVERLASSIGVPLEAFRPIVEASVANAFTQGPANAITGPAARGDHGTIDAHRSALSAGHGDEVNSYDALVELAHRLARLDG